jgi:secreted trypsin-like serine protease
MPLKATNASGISGGLLFQKILSFSLVLFCLASCALAPKVRKIASDPYGLDCKGSQILGGRSVLVGEAISKDAVLLLIRRGQKTSSCTGVPVSPRLILTAAHCVQSAPQDGITAIFHTDMKCASGYTAAKTIGSAAYVTHSDYDGTPQAMADLALVKLTNTIPADYPIPTFYDGKSEITSDEVMLLGFGITDETKHDNLELRTTTKSFSKDATIKKQIIGFRQDTKGGGFCRGDSGAPIYVNCGGVKKVIGINSFNIGTSKNNECHTASAGMYVPYFSSWIKNQIIDL